MTFPSVVHDHWTVDDDERWEGHEDKAATGFDTAVSFDPDAWESLYRNVYPGMFAFARRRLGSDAAADDAVSEALVRGLDRVATYVPSGIGLRGWLYGILRNVIHESHRQSWRVQPNLDLDRVSLEPNVDSRLLADEQQRALRAAFSRLDDADREILELRLVARLSAAQVGQVLDKQPGAVRMAQSRALDRLRIAMKEVTGAE